MPGSRLVVDGLWRCLCPSIDSIVTAQLRRPVIQPCKGRKRLKSTISSLELYRNTSRTIHTETPSPVRTQGVVRRLIQQKEHTTPAVYQSIHDAPIWYLDRDLARIKAQEGKYIQIVNLIKHLVEERGEKPSLLHYDALICANADAERGSAEAVRTLFTEMKDKGIVPNAELYHNMLKVQYRNCSLYVLKLTHPIDFVRTSRLPLTC